MTQPYVHWIFSFKEAQQLDHGPGLETTNQASFSPSNLVADPVVTVPSYGLYTFFWTFTDINTCTSNGQVDIDFREQPIAQSTDSLFFCQLLDNELEAVAAPSGMMGMWDIPVGNFNYNPIMAISPLQNNGSFGNYEAIWTVSNSPFCTSTSTTQLIYSAPEAAEIQGFDIQVCGYSHPINALNSNGTWSSPDLELSFLDADDPSTDVNASSSGAYTLVWTVGSGDCATSDSRTILFHDPAEVDITTTLAELCSDASVIVESTSSNGSALLWSSSGDGAFSNTDTQNTVYSPGSLDADNGTVTLTITNFGEGTCPDVSDQLTINVIPAITVSLPATSTTICSTSAISVNGNASGTDDVLWTSTGDGVFSPNTMSELIAYLPGPGDAASGSIEITLTGFPASSVCSNESATMFITLVSPPVAGDDQDITLCITSDPFDLNNALDPLAETGGSFADIGGTGALNINLFDPSIAGVGTHEVDYTVLGTFPCSNRTSTLNIEVISGPDAGQDMASSVCIAGPATNLSLFLDPDAEAGGYWLPHPGLTGSTFNQSVVGIGDYTFQYVVEGASDCEPDTAAISVTVTSGPSAGADGSASTCTSSEAIELFDFLNGTPDPGGTWTDLASSGGLAGVLFNPALSGPGDFTLEYVVALEGCVNDTSSVEVNVIAAPAVNIISSSSSICSIDTIFLEAGSSNTSSLTWTSSGTGTFQSLNEELTYYVPSPSDATSGIVDITVTAVGNTECSNAIDQISIAIVLTPTSNAGLDDMTCGLEYIFPAVPSVGSGIWSGPPGIVYSDNPNAPFTVPESGTYTFTWTENNQGCVDSDEVTIEFLGSPIISSWTEECINTNVEFEVVLQLEGGDPSSYQFSVDGTLVGTEFTSEAFPTGTPYSIAVWDANHCDTFLLESNFTCPVLTNPGSFAPSPLDFCEGDEIDAPFNNDEFLDANDALQFILHDADPGIGTILSTSNTPQFTFQPGMQLDVIYYVSAAAGNDVGGGIVDMDDPNTLFSNAVPITFHTAPTVSILTSNPSFCVGDSTLIEVSMTGNPTFELGYTLGGVSNQVAFENSTGNFYVYTGGLLEIDSISDLSCSTDTELTIEVLTNDIPTATIADSTYFCSAALEEIPIELSGQGPWTYTILYEGLLFSEETSISNIGSLLANSSGSYVITDLVDSNCMNPDSVQTEVIINDSPLADAGTDLEICSGDSAAIGGESIAGTSYSWSNPVSLASPNESLTQVILPSSITEVLTLNYVLTADFAGCTAVDSMLLTINPLPSNFGIDGETNLCEGESTIIEAYGGTNYQWEEQESLEEPLNASTAVMPLQSTVYFVEISNAYGCAVDDSIFISVHQLPLPQSSAVIVDACPPAQILWINETFGETVDCQWTFSEGDYINQDCSMAELIYGAPGLYSGTLTVTNIHGCENTAETDTIEVFPGEAAFNFSPDLPSTDDPILNVFDLSEDAASQLWLLNGDTAGFGPVTSISLEGLRPDYYEVCLVMTTNNACVDTTCHQFELDNPVSVFVPNTFTPDGDGLNDEFKTVINGSEYLSYYELSVYDRKGHVQFSSNDPSESWDGINRRGNTIAQGLFEWVLEIDVFGEARPRRYIGTVTVLK